MSFQNNNLPSLLSDVRISNQDKSFVNKSGEIGNELHYAALDGIMSSGEKIFAIFHNICFNLQGMMKPSIQS